MINKPKQIVSESTAMSFIPREYNWDYRHEHERRSLYFQK